MVLSGRWWFGGGVSKNVSEYLLITDAAVEVFEGSDTVQNQRRACLQLRAAVGVRAAPRHF